MAEVPKKKLAEPVTTAVTPAVSLSSLTSYLRRYDDNGRKLDEAESAGLRLSLAQITGSHADRVQYGPVFVDHAVSVAMVQGPIEQVPLLVQRAPLVVGALRELLASRRDESTGTLKEDFRSSREEYIRIAAEHRAVDPFVDAAMQTAAVLKNHEAEPLASDVVAALGRVAWQNMQKEVDVIAETIEGGNGLPLTNGAEI